MPYADPEKQKAFQRQHYKEYKALYLKRSRDRKKRYRKDWIKFKSTLACLKCGEEDYRCLDFHHRDPATKEFKVADKAGRIPLKTVLIEVAKCDVLCANCHRKI